MGRQSGIHQKVSHFRSQRTREILRYTSTGDLQSLQLFDAVQSTITKRASRSKGKGFPYLEYLRLTLAAIRKDLQAHKSMPSHRSNALCMVWLRLKEGQAYLRNFAVAREGSWAIRDDMEGM